MLMQKNSIKGNAEPADNPYSSLEEASQQRCSRSCKKVECIIEQQDSKHEPQVVYTEDSCPSLATLLIILGVTFSIPHFSVLKPYNVGGDLIFWLLLSAASLAVPTAFILLAFKALTSRKIEVTTSRVHVTVSRPILPDIRWTESLAEYRAVVVKRPPESSNEPITVVMLHRNQRKRNVPLTRAESEWEAHVKAEEYASLLHVSESTGTSKRFEMPSLPPQQIGSSDQPPLSQFEHVFIESYEIDGEYRLRQSHSESTRVGVHAGLLATTCALANSAYGGPIVLTIVCALIAALAAASIFRGALTYDYIRITQSGIARGTCICGSDREQTFIPANEVEDVVIFEDDLDKYPAVHIVGKEAVICFGAKSTDTERKWIKDYVEENFHTTTVEQSDLI